MKSQILRGDSPIFELDRWNFQQVLDLGFPETSQSLSSFKQLLRSSFHVGDQRKKNPKNCESLPKSGSSFPNRDPLLWPSHNIWTLISIENYFINNEPKISKLRSHKFEEVLTILCTFKTKREIYSGWNFSLITWKIVSRVEICS